VSDRERGKKSSKAFLLVKIRLFLSHSLFKIIHYS
jgi:hypothetical protein